MGKPLAVDSCGADRDGNGICDIIYPINLKEDKMNRKDWMGMVIYFVISILFGGGFGLIALIVYKKNLKIKGYIEVDTVQ